MMHVPNRSSADASNPRAARRWAVVLAALVAATVAQPARAGGAWMPDPGAGDVQIGFSRKTANTSWDAGGDTRRHSGRFENHDFRYTYLSGEVGLSRYVSASFVVTWLDGLEGPTGDLHRNVGWSDAWLGLKAGWGPSDRPTALRLVLRTPVLYDISGPYSLELYDDDGSFLGPSPEWRGLLKHDLTLSGVHSRSLRGGAGWWTVEAGYTWREGAPADQVPASAELGWTLPGGRVQVKGSLLVVRSLGNESPRRPDDRFGSRPGYSFNDASMARAGVSLIVPFGRDREWSLEAGYNHWIWGRSARQYEEPFLSLGRRL